MMPCGPPCTNTLHQCQSDSNDRKSFTVKLQVQFSLTKRIGEWFRTTVGVRQGCLLSPTLFNIFLERIMSDALADHVGTISIGGRTITNLRFADDIDGLAGTEKELADLVDRIDSTSSTYGMDISAEKTKLMTNSTQGIQTDIRASNQKLDTVIELTASSTWVHL